jgi:WD40 repeat protein
MEIAGENVTLQYQSSLSHNDWVKSIAFSPDGATLATGSFDSSDRLWNIPKGEPLQTLRRTSQDQVLSLGFSEDGNTLAAGTVRGQLRLWSKGVKEGQPLQTSNFYDRTTSNKYIDNYIGRLFYPSPATNDPIVVFTFNEAADLASFEFQSPEQVPDDFTLEAIQVLKPPAHPFEAVTMAYIHTSSYQPAILIITQSLENPKYFDQRIGQDAQINEIKVKGQMTEHVQGGWSFDKTLADNGGNIIAFQQIWDPESATQWLRWQEEEIFFSVRFDNPFNDSLISNQDQLTIEDIIIFIEGFH